MRYRPAPATHFASMRDETGVVLDLGQRQYLHLNGSGALLWSVLENGASLEELAEALRERYGIEQSVAHQDAECWIDEMLARGAAVVDE
ncbi:MAG: PqqD family protein [Myxococcota bacterium]